MTHKKKIEIIKSLKEMRFENIIKKGEKPIAPVDTKSIRFYLLTFIYIKI